MISSNALVGIPGSVTLREIGLPDALRDHGNKVADHWQAKEEDATSEEIMEIRREQLNADVFLTSTNAVTKTGELINIDGTGQRVAGMIFGPRKVIVISGVNKITEDVEKGVERARNIAAPINAKRLDRRTPCAKSGKCTVCDSEERICNVTTIIHRKPTRSNITVILIEENLGY